MKKLEKIRRFYSPLLNKNNYFIEVNYTAFKSYCMYPFMLYRYKMQYNLIKFMTA